MNKWLIKKFKSKFEAKTFKNRTSQFLETGNRIRIVQ